MKVIKPQKLGFLYKVFEQDRRCYLVVTVLVFFPFDAPRKLLPEVSLWKLVEKELGKDAVLDGAMNKRRAELLVHGSCYPRRQSTTCPVRVKLGPIDKTLYVIGDRFWRRGVPTEPQPFEKMPLTYEYAFGGEGYAENPRGKGMKPVDTPNGPMQPLPNIELPGKQVESPRDRPPPAGFEGYDIAWPQRFSKAGTYDAKWRKQLFPGFAKDIDWTVFNEAPLDQRIKGHFSGGEAFSVENMHPSHAQVSGALPKLVVRAFAYRKPKGKGDDGLEFVDTRLDTVHLFPHVERGVAIYRGVTRVRDDDAAEVLAMMIAAEAPDHPKSLRHYRTALAERLLISPEEKDPFADLRDSELLPPDPEEGPAHPDEEISDMGELLQSEQLLSKNIHRAAVERAAQAREELAKEGITNVEIPDPPPPAKPPSMDELMAKSRKDAKAARKKAKKAAKAAKAAKAEQPGPVAPKAPGSGPPKFSADEEIAKLESMRELSQNTGVPLPIVEQRLNDPGLRKELEATEQRLKDNYRQTAHTQGLIPPVDAARRRELREELLAKLKARSSVDGCDFTGADLSGLSLEGADLTGVFLESADLSGAKLNGAKLDRVVLARAKLSKAVLDGASLQSANLGSADLGGVHAHGADLGGAILVAADFSHADFTDSIMTKANLEGARFAESDLSGVQAPGLTVVEANWAGLKLARSDLTRCSFIKCDLGGVDFTEASLGSITLIESYGDNVSFAKAKLDNARVLMNCSFPHASFNGAELRGANLRGANLEEADFEMAELGAADLSECKLRQARFTQVNAVGARFIRADLEGADFTQANLMQALLQKATLRGAQFDNANLFRVDMLDAEGDKETSFRNALLKRVVARAPRKRQA